MTDDQEALAAAERIMAADFGSVSDVTIGFVIDAMIVARALHRGQSVVTALAGEHGRPMPEGTRESGPHHV